MNLKKRIKMILRVTGLMLILTVLSFACSLPGSAGEKASSQSTIRSMENISIKGSFKLNIDASGSINASAIQKSVVSTIEYTITALDITVVNNSTQAVVGAFHWTPANGTTTYDVAITQYGQYIIKVIETAVNSGNSITSEKSSDPINVQPMIINVVKIVPGGSIVINNSSEADVYISGFFECYDNMTNEAYYTACYWKNGTRVDLGKYSFNNSIYIYGNDVYCGGYYQDGNSYYARYWKNGAIKNVELSSTLNFSAINKIFVSSGNVYCIGYETSSNYYNEQACYWINDKKYSLSVPSGATSSYTGDIFIDENSNFYIAGYYYKNATYACYWKNGGECITIGNANSNAFSVKVVSGKLYISGYNNGTGVYWIDGTANVINGSFLKSTVINNGDVFSAGMSHNGSYYLCAFWKNTTKVWQETMESYAESLFLYFDDVYIAGYTYSDVNKACYWKNGIRTELQAPDYGESLSTSVFVKPRL